MGSEGEKKPDTTKVRTTENVRRLLQLSREAKRVPEDLAESVAVTVHKLLTDVEKNRVLLEQRTNELTNLAVANTELAMKILDYIEKDSGAEES